MNKYINDNSINWLLEEKDAEIRYLTLKELSFKNIAIDLNNEEKKLIESTGISVYIKSAQNNILGDMKNFDLFYRGTLWVFALLAECGLDIKNITMLKTAEYIKNNWQLKSGGFSMNWNPPIESAGFTGAVLKSLLKAGYEDEALQKAVSWIIKNQRHDGGWLYSSMQGVKDYFKFILMGKSGSGLKNEKNKNQQSCPFATLSCLEALLIYKKKYHIHQDIIDRSVNYIFSTDLLNKRYLCSVDNFYQNKNIYKLGYPILLQYDILKLLLIISEAGYFNDRRTSEAFNYIIEQQTAAGKWCYQSTEPGMIFNKYHKKQKDKADKWVSLNAIRLMKYAEI